LEEDLEDLRECFLLLGLESEDDDSSLEEDFLREERFFLLLPEFEEESVSYEDSEVSDELEEAEEVSGEDFSLELAVAGLNVSFKFVWYSKSPSKMSKHRRAYLIERDASPPQMADEWAEIKVKINPPLRERSC
jgi:hypothetical protein